jgi:hypothetical protein
MGANLRRKNEGNHSWETNVPGAVKLDSYCGFCHLTGNVVDDELLRYGNKSLADGHVACKLHAERLPCHETADVFGSRSPRHARGFRLLDAVKTDAASTDAARRTFGVVGSVFHSLKPRSRLERSSRGHKSLRNLSSIL